MAIKTWNVRRGVGVNLFTVVVTKRQVVSLLCSVGYCSPSVTKVNKCEKTNHHNNVKLMPGVCFTRRVLFHRHVFLKFCKIQLRGLDRNEYIEELTRIY